MGYVHIGSDNGVCAYRECRSVYCGLLAWPDIKVIYALSGILLFEPERATSNLKETIALL